MRTTSMRAWPHVLSGPALLLVLGLALSPRESAAQPHEKRESGYVVRGSTVPSQSFDAATARAHGIEPTASRGVLNVTVSKVGQALTENLRADVRASARELTGRKHEIQMRPVVSNNMVSYIGVFEFVHRQVLTFEIVATPQQSGKPVILSFEERF